MPDVRRNSAFGLVWGWTMYSSNRPTFHTSTTRAELVSLVWVTRCKRAQRMIAPPVWQFGVQSLSQAPHVGIGANGVNGTQRKEPSSVRDSFVYTHKINPIRQVAVFLLGLKKNESAVSISDNGIIARAFKIEFDLLTSFSLPLFVYMMDI